MSGDLALILVRSRDVRRALAGFIVLLLCSLFARPALAHAVPVSYVTLGLRDEVAIARFRLDAEILYGVLFSASLPADASTAVFRTHTARLIQYLDEQLPIADGNDGACHGGPLHSLRFEHAPDGARVSFDRDYVCSKEIAAIGLGTGFFQDSVEQNGISLVLASGGRFRGYTLQEITPGPLVVRADNLERVISSPGVEAQESGSGLFEHFFREGFSHILAGFDHLLFLLALILSVRRWRELAVLVTTFTLAHSLTLVLGALDLVRIPGWLVEPAIAFSIVYVCAENLWRSAPRHRLVVTFVFGLIHGLGFSSAVQALAFPVWQSVVSILSFNLGVESGQLLIVIPAFALCLALRRAHVARGEHGQRLRSRGLAMANVALGLTASIWLLERLTSGV